MQAFFKLTLEDLIKFFNQTIPARTIPILSSTT